ncbi:SUF system NifU family Fe-S cluster assembly protein [Sneathiella sp. P13V-1]|uniref:Fe-S cluster assembly sulfur transfer protein SufU n=1 Tax=Sneathiella sp. P13V-1 TaxID=2697366 RepID=UPI001D113E86|nr:SUF system NifU family Fe-S cluster assembly protein [Sneathiella sp. P13V-1]MBE7637702.1 SUF system NifU family Fe-S cluster assembly protein [Sneathiella sp. P13V-1]
MMDDLKELYQEVILDHSKSPRNFGVINPHGHEGHGHNPLCGDTVTLYTNIDENGIIIDISFEGKGCAISIASASLLTQLVKGKTVQEAEKLFEKFHTMLTEDGKEPASIPEELRVLAGVKQFPMRVKCATLSWHALKEAMPAKKNLVTEQE